MSAAPAPRYAWVGLAVILIAFTALATVQSFATRLQWGPDEPAHIVYLRSLAEDGRMPLLVHSEKDTAFVPGGSRTYQAQHPPLYYLLAAPVWVAFGGRPADRVQYLNPSTGTTESFLAPGAVRPVRLLSVAFGALTLLCIWATARTAFPARPALCLAGLGLTAFTPMFTWVNGVISNDPLLALVFAAAAWRWARVIRFGSNKKELAALALVLGIGLNVKETALALLPVTAATLALDKASTSWGQRAGRIAEVLGVAALLGGWWFLYRYLAYGSALARAFDTPLLSLPPDQRAAMLGILPSYIFIFAFVPADVVAEHLSTQLLYAFFGLLAATSLVGIARWYLRRKQTAVPTFEFTTLLLWLATTALVGAGLYWNLLTVDWRMGTSGGRLLVPVLPLAALAAARGLSALFGEGRWANAALLAVLLLLIAVNVAVIRATALGYGTL